MCWSKPFFTKMLSFQHFDFKGQTFDEFALQKNSSSHFFLFLYWSFFPLTLLTPRISILISLFWNPKPLMNDGMIRVTKGSRMAKKALVRRVGLLAISRWLWMQGCPVLHISLIGFTTKKCLRSTINSRQKTVMEEPPYKLESLEDGFVTSQCVKYYLTRKIKMNHNLITLPKLWLYYLFVSKRFLHLTSPTWIRRSGKCLTWETNMFNRDRVSEKLSRHQDSNP